MDTNTPKNNNKIIKAFVRFIGCSDAAEQLVYGMVEKFGGESEFINEMNTLFRGEPDNFIKTATVFDDAAVLALYKQNQSCINQSAKAFTRHITPAVMIENSVSYGGHNHGLSDDAMLSIFDCTQEYNDESIAIFATRYVMYNIAQLYGSFYDHQVQLSVYADEEQEEYSE